MVFSSPYFVFLFLPAALLICLPWRGRTFRWLVFVVSLAFYFWSSGQLIFLLLGVIVLNFIGGQIVERTGNRLAFIALIVANVAILLWFKYRAFAAANIDSVFHTHLSWSVGSMVLPAGISFFVFQAISYLTDIRRREIPADRSFSLYAAYQAFFPHLIAGPIVRYRDVIGDFLAPKISGDLFAIGVTRFVHGLFKKVVIADTVAPIVDASFALPAGDMHFAAGWTGATAYALQIYFDFSGYSDMAIGLAAMFGIRFTENFARPYVSRSITEFWRRWHITLSSWFRDYVYIPLGGSRRGTLATTRNLLIVFVVTGLWHGAAWTFLAWGLYHGFFLVAERLAFGERRDAMERSAWRYCYALPVVIFGWVLFRSDTIEKAAAMWRQMLNPWTMIEHHDIWSLMPGFTPVRAAVFIAACLIFVAPGRTSLGLRLMKEPPQAFWRAANLAYTFGALVVAAVVVLTGSYSPFLYFAF
jgi:alginate O-acetyltransferase complex protein AlgI